MDERPTVTARPRRAVRPRGRPRRRGGTGAGTGPPGRRAARAPRGIGSTTAGPSVWMAATPFQNGSSGASVRRRSMMLGHLRGRVAGGRLDPRAGRRDVHFVEVPITSRSASYSSSGIRVQRASSRVRRSRLSQPQTSNALRAARVEASSRAAATTASGISPRGRSRGTLAASGRARGSPAAARRVYGCLGFGVDLRGGPDLDDLAEVHDRDPVAEELRRREVVGDVDVGEVELVLELDHQLEDLRPDAHVEHRDRLVGDQDVGPEDDRPGEHRPLLLAAGEVGRVLVDELRRRARGRRARAPRRPGARASARGPGRSRGSAAGRRPRRRSSSPG